MNFISHQSLGSESLSVQRGITLGLVWHLWGQEDGRKKGKKDVPIMPSTLHTRVIGHFVMIFLHFNVLMLEGLRTEIQPL